MAAEVNYEVRKIRFSDVIEVYALSDKEGWSEDLQLHQSYHAMNPNHAYVAVSPEGKVISKYI